MNNKAEHNFQRDEKDKRPRKQPDKTPAKTQPDEGQGSEGTFGDDGDWGKQNEDLKRKQREASPIPIKEAK
jgi:hypothetical protein